MLQQFPDLASTGLPWPAAARKLGNNTVTAVKTAFTLQLFLLTRLGLVFHRWRCRCQALLLCLTAHRSFICRFTRTKCAAPTDPAVDVAARESNFDDKTPADRAGRPFGLRMQHNETKSRRDRRRHSTGTITLADCLWPLGDIKTKRIVQLLVA